MLRYSCSLILFGLLFQFSIGRLEGADNNAETKLREALRNTMLQLRTAQNERAALQASQLENEQKLKALTAQVATLTKQAAVSEKTIADQEAQVGKFKQALEKWEKAYKEAVDLANGKETARAKLANDAIMLQRRVADQQSRNAAMFRIGNEVLTRYERFSLGDALAAKEPFVGITRVKLETLVQDYQDKLVDAKIKPAGEELPQKEKPENERRPAKTQVASPDSPDQAKRP